MLQGFDFENIIPVLLGVASPADKSTRETFAWLECPGYAPVENFAEKLPWAVPHDELSGAPTRNSFTNLPLYLYFEALCTGRKEPNPLSWPAAPRKVSVAMSEMCKATRRPSPGALFNMSLWSLQSYTNAVINTAEAIVHVFWCRRKQN